MASTTIIKCDIEDCSCTENVRYKTKLQIIFTSDQTEGRSCEPYLSEETIDICEEHLAYLLKGNYIYGHGAQGYNKYYFKKTKK